MKNDDAEARADENIEEMMKHLVKDPLKLLAVEQPDVLKIHSVYQENPGFNTILFEKEINAKPGQFVNVWIPGIDEKPISISFVDRENRLFGITVFETGRCSRILCSMKKGGMLGIRGPYGNPFTISKKMKRIALVGGGCGAAPLSFLADCAIAEGIEVYFIVGAKTKDKLLYIDRMKKRGAYVLAATEDGSMGAKGFTTDVLRQLLNTDKVDMIYACGPEIMMQKVIGIADEHNLPCQISMERYMKCGLGVCGQCACDDRLVCKDGPAFEKEEVKTMGDFGKYARLKTGKKVGLKEYYTHGLNKQTAQ